MPITGVIISTTELLILAVPVLLYLSLLIRPFFLYRRMEKTFGQGRESVKSIRRVLALRGHRRVPMRWNTAGYIVILRSDDGHERDVFCIVHFHPFLPYVRRVEIPEE
jgi:hypothetical protein